MAEFIAELRRLAMHCQFDITEMAMLLAYAVKLFKRSYCQMFTFTEAFSMAKAMEAATINSKAMHQGSASGEGTPVYYFQRNSRLQPDVSEFNNL